MAFGRRALDKVYKRRNRYEIPDWQREAVWDRAKKQKLIDSILRGWKLPKFYFLKIADDEFEVVDGQQRLTAIFDFFSNELPLAKSAAEAFGGEFYKDLPTHHSDAFDDFEIEFDEIQDATDEEVKQFFQRLQDGLPLTSSEKLNSVHSKLRDYAKKLASHAFFRTKVAVADTRYAHFDICAKSAAVEIEGIDTGLRFDKLRTIFEDNKGFSPASAVGRRLKVTFDYLDLVFPQRSPLLKNRTIVQAFATLTAKVIASGKSAGHEKRLRTFFERFMRELAEQVELGQKATDSDYALFQRSVNANVSSGPRTRHEVLLRKLFQLDPVLGALFDPTVVAESGVSARVKELGESIANEIGRLNTDYSARHGDDLFKATNKTAQALTRLGKPIADEAGYQSLINDLYFLFRESIGQRLDGMLPTSFADVNGLRTDLQHDVDHGEKGKVRAKRKKAGDTFKKYSGTTSPATLAPDRFVIVQAQLLGILDQDLKNLQRHLT